jgi:uncharacterized protein
MEKTTLVLGASPNPDRVSYDAVKRLQKLGIPVIALGRRTFEDQSLKIITGLPEDLPQIHTISLYLSAENQTGYYNYIISLRPKRIIFNPGTINPELAELALSSGIEVIEGCMLVMLKTGQF